MGNTHNRRIFDISHINRFCIDFDTLFQSKGHNCLGEMASLQIILAYFLTFGLATVLAINCKGCTPLDTLSFDKLLSKFKVSIVKFDVAYPYGDKHEEFGKFSLAAAEVEDLFVGEVGIKDYGDKDNSDLADRFGVKKEDFPVVILFVMDTQRGKVIDQHRFNDEFKADNIKTFIRQKSGIYLPRPGCLEEFDNLADKLMTITDPGAKGKIIVEAETIKDKLNEDKVKKAEIYIKIMHKVVSEGEVFIAKETERVTKLIDGKISDGKKKQLEQRINILKSFARQKTKDEL